MKSSAAGKLLILAGTAVFIIHGHYISDHSAIKRTITANNFQDIDDIFHWVTTNYHQIDRQKGYSPRANTTRPLGAKRLLSNSQNLLWCDEGSILIGLMAGSLGYEYRLTDIYSKATGQSHHTTLEVKKGKKWLTYDFTEKSIFTSPAKSVSHNKRRFNSENKPDPKSRKYPSNPAQWILNNNGYLRELQNHANKTWDAMSK